MVGWKSNNVSKVVVHQDSFLCGKRSILFVHDESVEVGTFGERLRTDMRQMGGKGDGEYLGASTEGCIANRQKRGREVNI